MRDITGFGVLSDDEVIEGDIGAGAVPVEVTGIAVFGGKIGGGEGDIEGIGEGDADGGEAGRRPGGGENGRGGREASSAVCGDEGGRDGGGGGGGRGGSVTVGCRGVANSIDISP